MPSFRFEGGVSSDRGAGLGKDSVALGTMRKVEAGARVLVSSGFGRWVVWGIGSSER